MTTNDALSVRHVRNPHVLGASLNADEVVLLSVARAKYYGLNGPAARIWELLETPRTVAAICEALIAEFDVEPAECERETRELIAEMKVEGLVLIAVEPESTSGV